MFGPSIVGRVADVTHLSQVRLENGGSLPGSLTFCEEVLTGSMSEQRVCPL